MDIKMSHIAQTFLDQLPSDKQTAVAKAVFKFPRALSDLQRGTRFSPKTAPQKRFKRARLLSEMADIKEYKILKDGLLSFKMSNGLTIVFEKSQNSITILDIVPTQQLQNINSIQKRA